MYIYNGVIIDINYMCNPDNLKLIKPNKTKDKAVHSLCSTLNQLTKSET